MDAREKQREDDEADDALPLDMLDADIDWESSQFASFKRRHCGGTLGKLFSN